MGVSDVAVAALAALCGGRFSVHGVSPPPIVGGVRCVYTVSLAQCVVGVLDVTPGYPDYGLGLGYGTV
jgi:hypothetical protein